MPLTTQNPRFDVAELFPSLAGAARQTVRLHPRGTAPLPKGASKVGGDILWPADEAWPTCDLPHVSYEPGGRAEPSREPSDDPYVPVMQLRREDVPELGFPDDSDLFQLLWCPHDHQPIFAPVCRVAWRRATDVGFPLSLLPRPPSPVAEYVPRSCSVQPERVIEYPSPYELTDAQLAPIYEWERIVDEPDVYQYELSVADGMKVGGYVHWIQDPEIPKCGKDHVMEHLLTIASAEFDGGSWRRFLPIEEDGVWEAPYPDRVAAQSAAGLMIGDMGSLYVFICRACPDRPIETVAQSS